MILQTSSTDVLFIDFKNKYINIRSTVPQFFLISQRLTYTQIWENKIISTRTNLVPGIGRLYLGQSY